MSETKEVVITKDNYRLHKDSLLKEPKKYPIFKKIGNICHVANVSGGDNFEHDEADFGIDMQQVEKQFGWKKSSTFVRQLLCEYFESQGWVPQQGSNSFGVPSWRLLKKKK